eukprot:1159924-Pelagomonas_calceolata.AAC.10
MRCIRHSLPAPTLVRVMLVDAARLMEEDQVVRLIYLVFLTALRTLHHIIATLCVRPVLILPGLGKGIQSLDHAESYVKDTDALHSCFFLEGEWSAGIRAAIQPSVMHSRGTSSVAYPIAQLACTLV